MLHSAMLNGYLSPRREAAGSRSIGGRERCHGLNVGLAFKCDEVCSFLVAADNQAETERLGSSVWVWIRAGAEGQREEAWQLAIKILVTKVTVD